MENKPSASAPAVNALAQQALLHVHRGQYKEAIELYKKLWLNDESAEWRRQLAHCYLQTAMAFAARGQYREALAYWEEHCQYSRPPYRYYDRHLVWLILSHNPDKIRSSLRQLNAQQLDKNYPALAAILGLLIITGHPEFQQDLPQDSIFIAHLHSVRDALQALRDNDPDARQAALKQLPYRSAFRDFRILLQAAMTLPASPAEAQALLAQISASSPYAQIAALLLACTRKGAALAKALQKLTNEQYSLLAAIIGLDKQQQELLAQLRQQPLPLSDKAMFNLALQFRSLCGTELAQRFCLALLPRYPAGQRDYIKNFTELNRFEEHRLQALACEHKNNNIEAEYHWRQCIAALQAERSDNGLKIALILRRIAERHDLAKQNRLLIESLEHDPEDREIYLHILHNFSQLPDSAEDFEFWLAKTLERFPSDTEILIFAAKTAMRDKAYAEAGRYAAKTLTIDPLNTLAKQILPESHIAQARTLLKSGKFSLAEQELQQAEGLKLNKDQTLQVQLLRGLCCFASKDKTQGQQLVVAALAEAYSDPVNQHLQAAFETLQTNLPVAAILKNLPPAEYHILTTEQLARLAQQLNHYAQQDGKHVYLFKALEKIKTPLKKSLQQQEYSEELLSTLCQALDATRHFELLRHCAKKALNKWPKPIWSYYRIYSATNGDPALCLEKDAYRLRDGLVQAKQEKDRNTEMLIRKFLDLYEENHAGKRTGIAETAFVPHRQDFSDDPLDQLFGHVPEEIFAKLDKKIDTLTKKLSPEQLAQSLKLSVGKEHKILQAMMQNPDLYSALIVLKAASASGIDINVDLADILRHFGL